MTNKLHEEILSLREEVRALREELLERAKEHEKTQNELAFAERFMWEAISRLSVEQRTIVLALIRMSEKS